MHKVFETVEMQGFFGKTVDGRYSVLNIVRRILIGRAREEYSLDLFDNLGARKFDLSLSVRVYSAEQPGDHEIEFALRRGRKLEIPVEAAKRRQYLVI